MKRRHLLGLKALLFLPALAFPVRGLAQSLSGAVHDDQHDPLTGVIIAVPATHRQTVTGPDGRYALPDFGPGVYTVEFTLIGYAKETRTVDLSAGPVTVDVVMHSSPLEFPVITVTAKPEPATITNSAQPVDVLEGRELERRRGQSIGESIENLPGVASFSRGPVSMKPVIRGLTSQRVVVAENGMRHDSQQWDDEQSPEIDAFDVERIEVVRGSSSLLYGSDALGGVVNVIPSDPRSLNVSASRLAGNIVMNGFSNDRQLSGALTLFGSAPDADYKAQVSARHAGNIETPGGALVNSGADEINGGGMIRTSQAWGNLALGYSHFDQEFHISPDPEELASEPDLAPRQRIGHDKLHLSYDVPITSSRLEVHGTWQRNERSEFEDGDQAEFDSAQVKLRLSTLTLDVKLHHAPLDRLRGTVGVSVMSQKNETLGLEPLIPGFNQLNAAGFVYEEVSFSTVGVSAGVRFDSRRLEADRNEDLGVAAQTRNYTAWTGTAGAVWHASEPLSVNLNFGRGWRAPLAEELFINGADEGSIRFKVGNAGLEPEESFSTDFSARYATPSVTAEASLFHNRINRYIYLAPTAQIDAATGFTKYDQVQANATLYGGEFSIEAALTEHFIARGGFDFVAGRNDETDAWLPMLPANRIKGGIKWTQASLGDFRNPYLSVSARIVLDQDRIDQFEEHTGGYTLLDAGCGAEIGGARRVCIDAAVENLFDRAYADHLSRYKEYAFNPGRNITFKLSIPFTLVQ